MSGPLCHGTRASSESPTTAVSWQSVAAQREASGLVARLRALRPGLDEAVHGHVRAVVPGLCGCEDVEYEVGQFAAVAGAVDYGLSGIEHGEVWSGAVPAALLAQARRAAREGVPVDVVLRRCHAGQSKLVDFIMEEIEHGAHAIQPRLVRLILWLGASLLDRLSAGVVAEYMDEVSAGARSSEVRRVERIRRLLAGASIDTSGLDYGFHDVWHTCVIAIGDGAEQALRGLASAFARELLLVPRDEEVVWGWLGGSQRLSIGDIEPWPAAESAVLLAVGEPGCGIAGWRQTHRQAQAALRVALLAPQAVTRYGDVALIELWVKDMSLAESFVETHLSPLGTERDGGVMARDTLRAYFAAGHQLAAAAAALEIHRGTLRTRLAGIESRLGYPLRTRQAELEVALRLEGLLRGATARGQAIDFRTQPPEGT